VEVAIFRGNNRNRRRGFHNTRVFYDLIGRILAGERIDWIDREGGPAAQAGRRRDPPPVSPRPF